jgi:1,4-alpha-glucan branching enzyme
VRTRFLVTMMTVLLLSAFATGCGTASRGLDGASPYGIPVRFLCEVPGAARVCVSGSFNQWSSRSHCMRREGNTWSVMISLPSGRHEYGFVIDGDLWQTDPGAPLVEDNGFGRMNSVLILE